MQLLRILSLLGVFISSHGSDANSEDRIIMDENYVAIVFTQKTEACQVMLQRSNTSTAIVAGEICGPVGEETAVVYARAAIILPQSGEQVLLCPRSSRFNLPMWPYDPYSTCNNTIDIEHGSPIELRRVELSRASVIVEYTSWFGPKHPLELFKTVSGQSLYNDFNFYDPSGRGTMKQSLPQYLLAANISDNEALSLRLRESKPANYPNHRNKALFSKASTRANQLFVSLRSFRLSEDLSRISVSYLQDGFTCLSVKLQTPLPSIDFPLICHSDEKQQIVQEVHCTSCSLLPENSTVQLCGRDTCSNYVPIIIDTSTGPEGIDTGGGPEENSEISDNEISDREATIYVLFAFGIFWCMCGPIKLPKVIVSIVLLVLNIYLIGLSIKFPHASRHVSLAFFLGILAVNIACCCWDPVELPGLPRGEADPPTTDEEAPPAESSSNTTQTNTSIPGKHCTMFLITTARNGSKAKTPADSNASSFRTVQPKTDIFLPSNEICSICLDGYEHLDSVAWSRQSDCHHAFHAQCIYDWVECKPARTACCPICRRSFHDGL